MLHIGERTQFLGQISKREKSRSKGMCFFVFAFHLAFEDRKGN
jgi:hypothetical protein